MMIQANIRRENSMMPTSINNNTGNTRANSIMPCAFLRPDDFWYILLTIVFIGLPLKKEMLCEISKLTLYRKLTSRFW